MPKMKTHKSTKRRFYVTGSGKLMHSRVGKSHLRTRKAARVKREYRGKVEVHPTNRVRIGRLMPYA